jgi:S1-C subfamily serine protease
VTKLNDEVIRDGDHFVRAIGGCPLNGGVRAVFYRGGTLKTAELKLRRRELTLAGIHRDNQRLRWRGLLLGPVPANWHETQGTQGAAVPAKTAKKPASGLMVIAIDPRSPLAKSVSQGNILVTVGGKAVSDVRTLQQLINDLPAEQCALAFDDTAPKAVASGQE